MADTDESEGEDIIEDGESSSKKRKMLIGAGIGAVLLLAAAGGGAYWFLSASQQSEVAVVDGDGDGELEESEGLFSSSGDKAIYHRLRPNFITTFEANSKQRYMQTEVTLVTRDTDIAKELITHKPLIRHTLVLLFSGQDYLELQTPAGKEALKKAALRSVQEIMLRETGSRGIERVLFTEFVMQ